MFILKCDRCGRDFIPTEGIDRNLIAAKVNPDTTDPEVKVFDLCDECQMDLLAWWNYGLEKLKEDQPGNPY